MNRLTLSLLAGLAGCVPTVGCPEGSRFDDTLGCVARDAGPPADGEDAGAADTATDAPTGAPSDAPIPPSDAPIPPRDAGVDAGPDACAASTFYVDGDGDGFGVLEGAVRACVAPAGHSREAGDCDDADEGVSPASAERCDMGMADEDCDGTSNEGCECWEGQTRACPGASDVGECAAGAQTCGEGGRWPSACEGTIGPATERCDGLDNDCDAVVDGASADGTCPTWVGGRPRCLTGGTCGGTCDADYGDCGSGPGCETRLGAPAACTACGDVCAWRCAGRTVGCDDPTRLAVGPTSPQTVCAAGERGSLFCWGDNVAGEVLGAAGAAISRPVLATGLPAGRVLDTAVGSDHACAIVAAGAAAEGTVYCWGRNAYGQLGNGTTSASATPVRVAITTALELAAGLHSTCALVRGGTVQCWGYNANGQLGDGTTSTSTTPVAVADLAGATQLDGATLRYCAINGGGDVVCWGLGHTARVVFDMGASRTASQIALGTSHTCAITSGATFGSSSVVCWGEGSAGEIGDGAATDRPSPTVVGGAFPSGTAPIAIGAGSQHTCVVASNGTVRCWGGNEYGQLGDDTTSNRTTPTLVSSVTGAAAIDGGHSATCAVTGSGAVWCWGANGAGELGDGTTTSRTRPVRVSAP
jgi:alpha-tubulin suppressor-like RCC1 family protein